jgi:hypothetical protein
MINRFDNKFLVACITLQIFSALILPFAKYTLVYGRNKLSEIQ